MRLREIREYIKDVGDFEILKQDINSNVVDVNNISIVNERIAKLAELDFLDDSIEKLKSELPTIYNYRGGNLRLNSNDFDKYERIIKEIKLQVRAVLSAIDMALSPQDINSISIKLPEYQGLKKVGKFIMDMEKILTQILPNHLNTEVKLNTFDTGSNWIEVIVDNKEAIKFIGIFVGLAVKLAKENVMPVLKMKRALDSSRKVDQTKRTDVNDVLDVLMKEYASVKVEEIINQANLNEDNIGNILEYKQRLVVHMVDLSKYMAEGAEVYPALNAPEEVKEEFPDSQEVKSLTHEVRTLLIEKVVEKVLEEEDTE